MTLLNKFIDDEGEQTVVYGISREEWQIFSDELIGITQMRFMDN